jgi:hypothetical protein
VQKFVFAGLLGIKLTAGSFACNVSGAVGLFSWNATIGWCVHVEIGSLAHLLFSCRYNVISLSILGTLNDRFKRSIINTNPLVQHLLVWWDALRSFTHWADARAHVYAGRLRSASPCTRGLLSGTSLSTTEPSGTQLLLARVSLTVPFDGVAAVPAAGSASSSRSASCSIRRP